MNLLNESQVFETWAPILEEKTGVKDSKKLGWMSKYAHYHSLNEGFAYPQASLLNTPGMGNVAPASTVAGGAANFYSANALGSGDKFPSLLPLAIQVAARTVGFDIVPVIPMNGPGGVLTYLDYVYAGGRDVNAPGIKNQLGLTGNAQFTDKFTVFKVSRAGLGTTATTTCGTATAGDGFVFTANGTGATVDGLLTAFVGKSRIDGGFIFRILGESTAVTSVSSGAVTYTAIPGGSQQSIILADVLDGAATMFKAASVTPNSLVNPSTYTTGALTFVGSAGDITGSAELVRALEDHVQGFAGAGPTDSDAFSGFATNGLVPYEPMRRGVGETTQFRTMGLQAFTKFVEAETFQVAATVTTEQIQDLNRQYGIDVVSMMENALVNEISQSINKHILSRAFALGWQNHYDFNLAEAVNLNLSLVDQDSTITARFIGKDNQLSEIALPDIQFYAGTGTNFENLGTFQRRIQSRVLASANVVAQRGRRGPGNFVVTDLQIATALQDSAQFTFYPMAGGRKG